MAGLSAQDTASQDLSQGSRPAGDQDSLAFKNLIHFCPIHFRKVFCLPPIGAPEPARAGIVADRLAQFVAPHAPVRYLQIVRFDPHIQLVSLAEEAQQVVFGYRFAGHLVEPIQSGVILDDRRDQLGQVVGGHSGVDDSPVSANRFMILRQEPVQQRAVFGEFPANDGSPQSEGVGAGYLAEKLGLSVEILGVGVIFFGVAPTFAAEYAVGTEMDDASAPTRQPSGPAYAAGAN